MNSESWDAAVAAAKEQNDETTEAVTRIADGLPDTCPKDGCDKETRKRHFPKPHGVPEPAADRHEADCPTHGKVAGQR